MTNESTGETSIEYLHPRTPRVPGWFVGKLLNPFPWWVWPALAVVLTAPVAWWFGPPLTPQSLYVWPAILLFGGLTLVAFAVCVYGRDMLRRRVITRYDLAAAPLVSEARSRRAAFIGMVALWLIIATPIGLWTGAALRSGRMEQIRQRVTSGTMPAGPQTMLPFALSDTELYPGGVVILYTESTRGAFPASGSGFLYVPEGEQFPPYNRGSDGHLFGRWYWFTTD